MKKYRYVGNLEGINIFVEKKNKDETVIQDLIIKKYYKIIFKKYGKQKNI